MKRSIYATVGLVAAIVLAAPAPTRPDEKSMENRLRDQLRESVSRLRDVQTQYDALLAEKAAWERERETLKSGGSGEGSNALKAENAALRQALAEARGRGEAVTNNLNEVVAAARKIDAERKELAVKNEAAGKSLSATQSALKECGEKNVKLIDVGKEILAAYENVGFGTVLKSKEPFVGSKRVELENLAQGFGDRIYENTFVSPSAGTPMVETNK